MRFAQAVKLSILMIPLAAAIGVGQRSVMNQKPTAPLLGKEDPLGEATRSSLPDEKPVTTGCF